MIKRKLTFYGWVPLWKKNPFDRIAAARALDGLSEADRVLEHDEQLTAVEVADVGSGSSPTRLRLLALHDADRSPSTWEPGQQPRRIRLGEGEYTAFISHVTIWDDQIAVIDRWVNAPALGRLSHYLRAHGHGVGFRQLYRPSARDALAELQGWRSIRWSVYTPEKAEQFKKSGVFSSWSPSIPVPSFQVKISMGRQQGNGYLDQAVVDEVLRIADKAEEFLDALVITGHHRTETTATGKPATKEVNLLNQRLYVDVELPADQMATNLPDSEATWRAMDRARSDLASALDEAVELQPGFDHSDIGSKV